MKKFKENDRVIIVANYDEVGLIGSVIKNKSTDPTDYVRVYINRGTHCNSELFEENDLELFPENKDSTSAILHRIDNLETIVHDQQDKIEQLENTVNYLKERE